MKKNYADELFDKVLKECLEVRKLKKTIYGNSWLQKDAVDANFWGGIINKTNRLKILHSKRFDEGIEKYEDCLKDLVILTLFTLASFKDEQIKFKKNKMKLIN